MMKQLQPTPRHLLLLCLTFFFFSTTIYATTFDTNPSLENCPSGDYDGDGVCNDVDCFPWNPTIPAPVGTPCDDGDPNTTNDVIVGNECNCQGSQCAAQGGDSDGDGVCDYQDCAPFNPNLPQPQGTACDDNNPGTINDVIQADGCTCQGTTGGDPCAGSGDNDGDGVCNNLDCFPWNPTIPAPIGTPCDDGDPNTTNDVITGNECNCQGGGGSDPCIAQGGDTDGDGVCNDQDCQPNDPNFPTAPGTTCNDNNPNTMNDIIQNDGCTCAGTPVGTGCTSTYNLSINKSTSQSSTITANGITGSANKAVDGNTNGVFFANPPYASSVSATTNEYQAWWEVDLGAQFNIEQIKIYNRTDGSDKTNNCYFMVSETPFPNNLSDALAQANYQYYEPGLVNSPSVVNPNITGRYIRVQLNSTGYVILAEVEVIGCMPANLCVNQGGDADGDGVCADIDCNDADPSIPAAPGTICDDGNPNTTNDIIQSDGCTCAGTPINSGDVLAANVHPKFVNLLPDPLKINATNGGTFNLTAEQSPQWLGLQNANGTPILTNVWGYSYNGQQMILGPTFNIQKDVAIDVKWRNNLPFTHLLPVDETIHQARPSNGTPMVVHLHGGHTESASDGYPEAWFTQNYAETGPEWKKSTYHYTNDQEATMLWYHDHTLGQTRLQNYAGLSGMYIIRDANEASLNLPSGEYEREIVIQDKQFANNGSLYFPALLSDPEALDFPTDPNIEPTIFTEFFGDYILVNGMVWPKMNVEPTQYRLRLLNGSDSRFYIFKLSNGATFQQIGTDGGLLNHPVNLTQLILAPAERADIIVDFSGMAGQSVILQNVGPDEPFKGLAANQPPADPSTTGVIMRFDVQGTANASFVIPSTLRPTIKYLGQETNTRQLLLLESTDMYGRLKPSLGTAQQGQLGWVEPTTETPIIGETEVWEIYNNTEDAHPIHVHQIEFQLVNRQKFTGALDSITSQLTNIQLIGPPIAPAPNEQGWKDTYIVPPGQVARFKVKFDLLGKFVWHCHILSHEDWDMMRPMEVMPASAGGSNCSTTSNLALGKSTSQSSTITAGGITGLSSKAVDGNTNGVFFTSPPSASSVSATNYENQAWWEVDLGAIYNIDEVNIFNRTDGTDKTGPCYLLISNTPFANDLATARSQAHYEHFEPGQVGSPTSVTPNVSGRYVRVQLAGTGYMILAEVEVNGCSVNQPLAVPNMINFTAKKEGQQTHVSWLMAKDVDVDFYEVEVSTDGNEFELLEETLSSRANAPRSYELTDFHPSTGENFYRLKIYNLDGTSYYSAIRRVNFDINFDKIIIYPNPTNHKINITLRDFAGKEGLVEIYNHLGQKQYEQYYQSLPSIPMSLDVSKFTPGIYTVSIKIDNQKRFAKQFVVMDR